MLFGGVVVAAGGDGAGERRHETRGQTKREREQRQRKVTSSCAILIDDERCPQGWRQIRADARKAGKMKVYLGTALTRCGKAFPSFPLCGNEAKAYLSEGNPLSPSKPVPHELCGVLDDNARSEKRSLCTIRPLSSSPRSRCN